MKSSIVDQKVAPIKQDQLSAPTWSVLVFLVISMVILKSFVYIKDVKRHGK